MRENLKNVVLFMASSGYLVSPKEDPSKEKLWTETWKRIDRFIPELRSDLGPEKPEQEEEETKDDNEVKEKADDVIETAE